MLNAAIASYPEATVIRFAVEQQNPKGQSYWRNQKFVDVGTTFEHIGADPMAVITMERQLK